MKKGTASGRAIAVIPARFASTRFPGKPLTPLLGKPMVQHVYQRCVESGVFARVLVATDDERIAKAVKNFGGRAVMTSPNCHSGTDRVHQALAALELDAKSVVANVQGDEPALHPAALAALVDAFKESTVKMATLVRALHSEERSNPNVVKAVLDEQSNALYFSRADLPYLRASESALLGWAHVGIYGYRWATLKKLSRLTPTLLEEAEGLEQLRALGHGIAIRCCVTGYTSAAVDMPGDVAAAEAAIRALKLKGCVDTFKPA